MLVTGKRQAFFVATDHTNCRWYFTEHTLAPEFLAKRNFRLPYLQFGDGFTAPTPALAMKKIRLTVTTAVKDKRPTGVEVVDMNEQWAIVKGLPWYGDSLPVT